MEYIKRPLSIKQQIQLFENRGLNIPDVKTASRYLSNISYYRLRAYTYPYQENDTENHPFLAGVSIEDIMELYTFDRRLRLLVFDAIERIEIALRTQIIYHWSIKYGSHWHLNQKLYKDKSKFINQLNSLQKEVHRSNETFLKHYLKKYSEPSEPPCWMSLEVTSMGLLSIIFQNLRNCSEKKAVTHHFGIYSNIILENWIHNLCNVRNICAHHGRLWNRRIPIHLNIPKKTTFQFLDNRNILPYKLYASLAAIVYMLKVINPEGTFKQRLLELLETCPREQLKEMGFPDNWENDSFWKLK